jgi:methionyl-tRNA formyltransferase
MSPGPAQAAQGGIVARIVFMGTPDFAVLPLEQLIRHHEVVGVVTQPDRPAGRRQQLQMPPVKLVAQRAGIPVFQPEKVRRPDAADMLRAWAPELFVVAAFGQILPQAVLDIPTRGAINVHASLLPRWRGAAPIQAAIRAGDRESGVTIMLMDAGLDTGPMLTQRAVAIAPDETGQSLHDKLALLGADLLVETLPGYLGGSITPQAQDDARSTYAPMIKKDEGHIDWRQSAAAVERLVRAFNPWPGAYALWNGQTLKVHSGAIGTGTADPGAVITDGERVAIGTGAGLFYPHIVQLAGRTPLTVTDFVRGRQDFTGSRLT